MDATRLSPAEVPVSNETPVKSESSDAAATQMNMAAPVGGRFWVTGEETVTATGTVAIASDLKNGGKAVWLKTVSPDVLPTAPASDRALRELKQLSKVACQSLVTVLDAGRSRSGAVYVATEIPAGKTLEEWVRAEGPLSLERASSMVRQVGDALVEAQKAGVIHRDVAPRSIWIDAAGQVKLDDFAVAEVVGDRVFGAPAYLSPEQAEGKPADQRSNIYSLAAVLHFALTGAPPFEGDVQSLLSQQLSATPNPPSQKRPGLSPAIDRVVRKALEKSSGRRHLTLRQFVTDVQQVCVGGLDAPAAAASGAVAAPAAATAATMADAPTAVAIPIVAAVPPAIAATMMADSNLSPASVVAKGPVANAATMMAPSAPSVMPKQDGFRETAWFKKGELEEEIARLQAQHLSADPLAPTGVTGQNLPVDSSQIAVSAEERRRLSLKSGGTQMMPKLKAKALPGERMNEKEMLAEIDSSKKLLIIAASVVAGAIIVLLIYLLK